MSTQISKSQRLKSRIRPTVVKMHFDNCRNALPQLSKSISTYVKRFVTPEQNKIYADCSIVEFDFKFGDTMESIKLIGYFHFCEDRLRYIIRIKRIKNLEYVLYTRKIYIKSNVQKMSNFKVIGTLQKDKHLSQIIANMR